MVSPVQQIESLYQRLEKARQAEMHRNGHYVPGDDGRPIEEQLADIFPTS